jgi:hypothetical protein
VIDPTDATPDDERWEEEAADARHKSLDNVRATGKAWSESIGLILGAFTTAAFLKGPEALSDVPAGGFTLRAGPWTYEPAPTVVNVVLSGALVLAIAFAFAALAAQGTPGWAKQLTGRTYAARTESAAKWSIRWLVTSRFLTAIAAALILVGMAMAWTAQVEKPAGPDTTSAIVSAGGRSVCGTLSTAADGSVSVTPKGGSAAAVDPGSPVSVVESCP